MFIHMVFWLDRFTLRTQEYGNGKVIQSNREILEGASQCCVPATGLTSTIRLSEALPTARSRVYSETRVPLAYAAQFGGYVPELDSGSRHVWTNTQLVPTPGENTPWYLLPRSIVLLVQYHTLHLRLPQLQSRLSNARMPESDKDKGRNGTVPP
jgi:hypothetical protein